MASRRGKVFGHPLALDPCAQAASDEHPAFVYHAADAPPYYGFPILEEVTVDGFTYGVISDFLTQAAAAGDPVIEGDGFVVAPDGSRAGLIWEVSDSGYFGQASPQDDKRWGVWNVSFPFAMRTVEDARRNLAAVVPKLRPEWDRWRAAKAAVGR